jgi:hypothetical protein
MSRSITPFAVFFSLHRLAQRFVRLQQKHLHQHQPRFTGLFGIRAVGKQLDRYFSAHFGLGSSYSTAQQMKLRGKEVEVAREPEVRGRDRQRAVADLVIPTLSATNAATKT